jgi:hypothetical protein
MKPLGCPETVVRNCHCSLLNFPGQRRSHLLRGGSLNSGLTEIVKRHSFLNRSSDVVSVIRPPKSARINEQADNIE